MLSRKVLNIENQVRKFVVPDSLLHPQHAQSGHDGVTRWTNRCG